MNGAQLHLMLNHLPVMGALFCLLLLGWGLIRRSAEIQKVALVAVLLTGLSSVPVYLTGEPAEHVVEDMTGVDKAALEEHESMGKLALWCGVGLAVAAAVALGVGTRNPNGLVTGAAIVWLVNALVFGVMGYTAHIGGQIRHPEIKSGFAPPSQEHRGETHEERE
ncbi:MAG: hypothetical protein NZM28_03190 [Fimbriimonadales bacterium]|nr:hypothetical protein [Fimbriimonadales bacterium]